ncbi:hypothetical protein BgiBS90_025276, partial [Biomphalaria glabrata]
MLLPIVLGIVLISSSNAYLENQMQCSTSSNNLEGEIGNINCNWTYDNKYTPQSLKFKSFYMFYECAIKSRASSCLFGRLAISIQESEARIRINELTISDNGFYTVELLCEKENTNTRYYVGQYLFLSVT